MVRFAILAACILTVLGCGGKRSDVSILKGKVTYKGQAVNGGAIVLTRVGGEALSKKGGKESISIPLSQEGTFQSNDVAIGEYKVVIQPEKGSPDKPPKELAEKMSPDDKARWEAKRRPATIKIPEKYTKPSSSDLTLNVGTGETSVTLELKD